MSKDIKAIVKKLERQGWEIEDRGPHLKAWPPDKTKQMVVISKTPSDRRSMKNLVTQLRRSGANL